MSLMTNIYPVIIIGAGPAGIASAIQLKRSGIDPLIIEKDKCGGLLRNAFLVENYPGFYNGISGIKLISYFTKHLEKLSIKPVFDEVKNITYSDDNNIFTIHTKEKILKSKIAIIATGLKHKESDIVNTFSINTKKNIYYNISDFKNPKGKNILIVGAGDASFDYALNLSSKNKIVVINRGKKIKALNLLHNRLKKNTSIEYLDNTIIKNIISKKREEVLLISNNIEIIKTFDIILFAIGRKPDLSFISSQILEKRLELETKKVLFFIGDIVDKNYRQTSIAVGDGVKVAMEISNLENLK